MITRRTAPASVQVRGGADDYAGGSGQWAVERGSASQLLSVSADRSSGFMYDRDFKTAIVRSRTSFGRSTVSLSYLWKGFGANNFYGGNAPSREWTNQTLVAAEHGLGTAGGWNWRLGESYRTHGDHFIFNQINPALSTTSIGRTPCWPPSRDRGRPGAARATVGVEGGGDWIRSTNLGDHSTARAERLRRVAAADREDRADRRHAARRSLQRVRHVVEPVARRRLVAGVAAAPARLGRPRLPRADVHRALLLGSGQPGACRRRARARVGRRGRGRHLHRAQTGRCTPRCSAAPISDVIDWLRPSPAVRWQTYNVRDVSTKGVELSVSRSLPRGGFVQAGYTGLDLDASAVDQLSKYVLDFAPHSLHRGGLDSAAGPAADRAAARGARASPSVSGGRPAARRSATATTRCSICACHAASVPTTSWPWKAPTCSMPAIRRLPAWRCPARSGHCRWP